MSPEKRDLSREIDEALADDGLQTALRTATARANAHRREAIGGLPDAPETRRRAREIRERAVEAMPELLERLESSVRAAGGDVHRAVDAREARRIVVEIARAHGVGRAVKSKSMTTEEIDLNDALEDEGIAVRETDLGEFVVQIAGDRPSHIVAPIIHMGLEEVRRVFRDGLGVEAVPGDPEGLTRLARRLLRQEFLEAEMGITGANFLLADSGTVVLVENEGNARLTAELPPVHVVVAGVEKVIPGIRELLPLFRLLPRSATGQLQTSYVSLISPPGAGPRSRADGPGAASDRAFHLVLVDNGRTAMRDDPVLREALYCIRCGACLNACPPFQAVGGHVYGGDTYQSGIGNAWEAGVAGDRAAAGFNRLCTTCTRCRDVCPVDIDIPWINAVLRERLAGRPEARTTSGSPLARSFFSDPARVYRWGRATAPLSGWLLERPSVRRGLERLVGLDRHRPLPRPAPRTVSRWHAGRGGVVVEDAASAERLAARLETATVALLVDCHTEHVDVEVGRTAVRVLEALGVRPLLVAGGCCGRAAVSQGALDLARRQARGLGGVLAPLTAAGIEIVGLEPSCLTAVTDDHEKLLPDAVPPALAAGCRDLMAWLAERPEDLHGRLGAGSDPDPVLLVLHGHCQQKTAGWLPATVEVLSALPGCRVEATTAECCGMAGSFGYKAEFYGISVELGRRLLQEVEELGAEAGRRERVVHLAPGTSCRAQLRDLGDTRPLHPIQFLARRLGVGAGNGENADAPAPEDRGARG